MKPEQLRGAVLFGGLFDADKLKVRGILGERLVTGMWAYFGVKTLRGDERLETFSIRRQVGASFPPTFISAAMPIRCCPSPRPWRRRWKRRA